MKVLVSNKVTGVTCMGVILSLWIAFNGSSAQEKPTELKTNLEQIKITADALMVDSDSNYAEFLGNVLAVQGSARITADTLRIYYKSSAESKASGKEDSIEKITAKGKVTIHMDDRTAEADEATYLADEKILTLTGSNSRISRGNDSISGSKIIFNRSSGKISVEGGAKPVEAILFSGPKGLQ